MKLRPANKQLDRVVFLFGDDGNVADIEITVRYDVVDDDKLDEDGNPTVRVGDRDTVSVWEALGPDLTKRHANSFGKRMQELAEAI